MATLRTLRELFRQGRGPLADPPRAWDVAFRSGVSIQGSADSLRRLEECGLVYAIPARRRGSAPGYRLDREHPLHAALAALFQAEGSASGPVSRSRGSNSSAQELMQ